VVGEVLTAAPGPAVDPLLYYDRGFTELAWS
jgi:hypothetical protein